MAQESQQFAQRRYTITEMDAMRVRIRDKYLWGRYGGPFTVTTILENGVAGAGGGGGGGAAISGRSYVEADLSRIVEDQLRSAMVAGLTAADLVDPK